MDTLLLSKGCWQHPTSLTRNVFGLAKESTLTIREATEMEKEKISPVDTIQPINIKRGVICQGIAMIPKVKGQVLIMLSNTKVASCDKELERLTQVH